ncbi:MAG: peptide deformylase [Flavobacteriaceae bacterium]|nr:peptide deformylase [Flavobacteriaceae bacterium]
MQKLLIFGFLITTLVGCGSLSQTQANQYIFSKEEQELILSGQITEPMRILQITQPSDSLILRTQSVGFNVQADDMVLNYLADRMLVTLQNSKGVGIAAPQVGILKRIIWVQRLDLENEPFEVYYNPEIKKYSDMKQDVREGCLSIPDYRGTTQDRAYAVFVEYDDRKGSHKCEMIEAFTAAIFQHEIDHLNGIMFIDHLIKERDASMQHKID